MAPKRRLWTLLREISAGVGLFLTTGLTWFVIRSCIAATQAPLHPCLWVSVNAFGMWIEVTADKPAEPTLWHPSYAIRDAASCPIDAARAATWINPVD